MMKMLRLKILIVELYENIKVILILKKKKLKTKKFDRKYENFGQNFDK